MSTPWCKADSDSVLLRAYVQPKASRTEVVGEFGPDGDVRLKIRIAAPPVDGAANEELLRFVREITGLPSAAVRLVRGETSRAKDVRISGLSVDRAVALFRPK